MLQSFSSSNLGLDMVATEKKIRELIKESGLTDKQLSEIMNLSVQAINKWRHGQNIPDIENLYILSRVFGKKIDDFLVAKKPLSTKIFPHRDWGRGL